MRKSFISMIGLFSLLSCSSVDPTIHPLTEPSPSSAAACPNIAINHGGHLLNDPEVHFDFWGAWGTADILQSTYENVWFSLINNDNVLQRLSEYGIHEGTMDSNSYFNIGSIAYKNDGGADDAGTFLLDDGTFGTELNKEIALGALPYPNDNTLYIIMLPPGTSTWTIYSHGWGGYHNHYSYDAQAYAYAVIYYAGIDNETTISHEIYEAATNPTGQGYWTVGNAEVADLCEGGPNDFIGGVWVQKVWSNKLCQCL